MSYSYSLESNGYHYTRIKGLYRSLINMSKPCLDDRCRCGGHLYHSYTRHDLVVCEDCGLTYIVLLIREPKSKNTIRQ